MHNLYHVVEWDGSVDVVAVKFDGDKVVMKYPDGEVQWVFHNYFFNTMRAVPAFKEDWVDQSFPN